MLWGQAKVRVGAFPQPMTSFTKYLNYLYVDEHIGYSHFCHFPFRKFILWELVNVLGPMCCSSFITWMVYLDPTHCPAHSWLVILVGRTLHRYRLVQIPYGPEFFSGPIFNYSFPSVVLLAARIS